jgi:hypothetical protein
MKQMNGNKVVSFFLSDNETDLFPLKALVKHKINYVDFYAYTRAGKFHDDGTDSNLDLVNYRE